MAEAVFFQSLFSQGKHFFQSFQQPFSLSLLASNPLDVYVTPQADIERWTPLHQNRSESPLSEEREEKEPEREENVYKPSFWLSTES